MSMRVLPDVLVEGDFPVEFGRYTLLGLLGEGGMARVFKAELQGPEGFRKRAAVKIVRSSVAADNERLRVSLINEARLGGLLHHPNVVDTYDFGEVDGLPYIAMEMVRGLGLEKVLALVDPLPPAIALEIGIQMLAGLDHAHNLEDVDVDSELIHRDLKPSNVIISRDGLVKVMDFGIAKAAAVSSTNTATGMTKGTPSYMSPEQVNGEPLDRRSDLFAMGAILYELFTGKRLFLADSLMSILMAVIQVEERLATSRALEELDTIVPGLAGVIGRCLRRDRTLRYDDAATLEHELKLIARSIEPPPPLKLWIRELMAHEGIGVGESSISTLEPGRHPATTLKTGPAAARTGPTQPAAAPPVTQPTEPAAAAPPPTRPTTPVGIPPTAAPTVAAAAASEVPPTRAQPVPAAPPPTPAQPTPAPPPGTLYREAGVKRRRKKKQGASGLVLLLLGLLVGAVFAAVLVVGAVVLINARDGGGEAASDGVVQTDPVDPADASLGLPDPAVEPTPAARRNRTTPAPRRETTTPAPTELVTTEPADTGEPATEAPVPVEATPTPIEVREAPRADPTPAPTPAPTDAASERDRIRAERLRELGMEGRTQREDKGDDDGPFRLSRARAREVARDDDGIKMRFSVLAGGARCEDPTVTLHYNPPGASWLEAPMRDRDDGSFRVNVTFKPKNQGKSYYWVQAVCPDGATANAGSANDSFEINVE
jgi:serine/threonine protein kinase